MPKDTRVGVRPVESVGAEGLHRVFCARRDQRANAGAHSCAVWVRRPSPCIQRNQHPSQPTLLLLHVCEHARAYASSYNADGKVSQVAWPYGIYAFRTRRCGRGFGFGVYDCSTPMGKSAVAGIPNRSKRPSSRAESVASTTVSGAGVPLCRSIS